MSESEPQRRRGRPRVSDEERKRHTLTFRMRSDLRDAVEELAVANNRTLSEQVEYYVDSGVFTEAKVIYDFSTDAISPALYRCISNREVRKSEPHLNLEFPTEHREMLTIAGKNHLNGPKGNSRIPWVKEPGGEDAAIDMARALLDGTVRGVFEAFEEMLGPGVVSILQSDGAIGQSSINIKTNRAYHEIEERCLKAELEVERLRAQLEALRSETPRLTQRLDLSVARPHDPNGDFSIATLRDLVAQFGDNPPDLSPLRDARWPKRFKALPSETREVLLDKLGEEAGLIYEALMVPVRSFPAVLKKGTKPSRTDFDRITVIRALNCIRSALEIDATSKNSGEDARPHKVQSNR